MFRRQRGSFLLVITFATLMSMVVVSMLILATTLYISTKDSSRVYSDLQSYRAGMEIACYQYISDLQGITVTKDLDGDWIGMSEEAAYLEALDVIKETLASDEDGNAWYVSDLSTAVSGANISDSSVLTSLLGKLAGVRQSFKLSVPEPLRLDWDDPESWRDSDGAFVALDPVCIEVMLSVKGETLIDTFYVDGLFLDVVVSKQAVIPGERKHEIWTMCLTEMESGVNITRETITQTIGSDNG